ncbi:MAG: DUF349 domain-containing protein [Bacteroidota bacterium]
MEINPFISELNTLINQDDLINLGRDAQELKIRFEDFILEEERVDQVNSLNAADEGEIYEKQDFSTLKQAFYELYDAFKNKRNQQKLLRDTLEKENLKLKRSLISNLQDVIENEENIGVAYNAQKEIHETWKKVGDIPRDKRDEVQRDYSRMLEIFFHNMKIYRELKDHDYHRNAQLKFSLINQLEALNNSNVVKDMESALKTLQNEWEEIGPVHNDEWEKLKIQYWDAVRSVYEKINQFYNERRNIQSDNLLKKKDLVAEILSINSKLDELNSPKLWEKASQNIIKIQSDWKLIGQASRKENDEVWNDFRAACDHFFKSKKAFFKESEVKQKEVVDKKRKLIEQARSIQDSTDWKASSEKLIRLQKEWKNSGNSGPRYENKLWTEFRAVCDNFFNARAEKFKEQESELLTNLELKKQVIEKLENIALTGVKKTDLDLLKEINEEFKLIGDIPNKQREEINSSYQKAMDTRYSKLNIDANEKELILFKARFDNLPGDSTRSDFIQKERSILRKQIDQLSAEVIQMETNLSFFSKSKGADSLRKEVDKKIALIRRKIEMLRLKLKAIPSE